MIAGERKFAKKKKARKERIENEEKKNVEHTRNSSGCQILIKIELTTKFVDKSDYKIYIKSADLTHSSLPRKISFSPRMCSINYMCGGVRGCEWI